MHDPLWTKETEARLKRIAAARRPQSLKEWCLRIRSRIHMWGTRLNLWVKRVYTLPSWEEVAATEKEKAFNEMVLQMQKEESSYFRDYMLRVVQNATKFYEIKRSA